MRRQKFNDTIEVFCAKSVGGVGHRHFEVVVRGLVLLDESLMNHVRVEDGARGGEDSEVSPEHITGHFAERMSVDTNVAELPR